MLQDQSIRGLPRLSRGCQHEVYRPSSVGESEGRAVYPCASQPEKEQATSPEFRHVLKDPGFRSRIGLIAIDEVHLVSEWREFRGEYTHLIELRRILGGDQGEVPLFGCSATIDSRVEEEVKTLAGFSKEDGGNVSLEIIRTSVDRPEIALCTLPIPRGQLSNFDHLYFLLAEATHPGGHEVQTAAQTAAPLADAAAPAFGNDSERGLGGVEESQASEMTKVSIFLSL